MARPPSPTNEQLLALLQQAIIEAPAFPYRGALDDHDRRWLGQADAVIAASGAVAALASFRVARDSIGGLMHSRDKLLIPLYDAYSRLELLVPAASQGAFIPGGETWDGYAALVRIFQQECDDLLVVDPYLNSSLYTELAPHAAARHGVRCLTTKRSEYHPGLAAAAARWSTDPSVSGRGVEVRYVPATVLHDRLLILDSFQTWLISQSLKDIAKKSPASVTKAEEELGKLKAQHYNVLWNNADPIV